MCVIAGVVLMGITGTTDAQETRGNWIRELSEEEFMALQTYQMLDTSDLKPYPRSEGRDFPDVWDWREMTGVTDVRDQGQCGSCWAFTAHGVLEAQLLIQTGVHYDLSEQQLVDCTPGSYGCNGGNTETAWSYLSWEPARIEVDYPYEAENGECRTRSYPAYVRTTGYDAYYSVDQDDIKQALMDYGPVATHMGANDNLKAYTGGCYADDSTTQINHGVVIVGWDDTVCDGGSWIVKNSWGLDFGDNGYFYIRRGDVHLGEYFSQVYFEIIPAVEFEITYIDFLATGNTWPVAGDSAGLEFTVKNSGRESAVNVVATLTSDSPLVSIIGDTLSLPDLAVGESIDVNDAFNVSIASGALPGEMIPFELIVTSDAGESRVPASLVVGPIFPFYSNDFEGDSDEGWIHGSNRQDQWSRGMPGESDFPRFDPEVPYSGEHMWGLRLNKSGNYPANHNTWLNTPVFDCTGHSRVVLRFKRWLSVEKGIYDHATVVVNGETVWTNPTATDLIDTSWQDILMDVTEYIGQDGLLQITFTLDSDGGLEFGGWNIDDFQLLSGVDSTFQTTWQDRMDLDILMPDLLMEPSDTFLLYTEIRNYGPERDINEFIALEVGGMFWFWPEWTETPGYQMRTISGESFTISTVLTFAWPEISGHAEGIRFWQAALEATSGSVLDYDMIEWAW